MNEQLTNDEVLVARAGLPDMSAIAADAQNTDDGLAAFITMVGAPGGDRSFQKLSFIVPNMNCANCMNKIERHFASVPGLSSVRVNLSRKEVAFQWPQRDAGQSPKRQPVTGDGLFKGLQEIGFEARPIMPGQDDGSHETQFRHLLWCMAVAGFASANVMLLSVSVWSGAEGATRDLFHWLSALIALPAIAYAGRPFFNSAVEALKSGHVNMDVPISLAVILAAGLSLHETMNHGDHAFFDAAVTLLFFLLIGRTLDHLMRAKAFQGVRQLLALKTETALIIDSTGQRRPIAVRDVQPDMEVLVRPGETVPIDGVVTSGTSDVDWSLVNGEPMPRRAGPGDEVFSGLINVSGPLSIRVTAVGADTLLSEIIDLMEAAQSSKPRYRQLAERAASLYVPLVHSAALITFVLWLVFGLSWQTALYHAIAVLIITCPCALGLAVPVVQVVASSIAQRAGVLMKDGAALERLGEIDTVVFDKTGTLTLATPKFAEQLIEVSQDHNEVFSKAELIGAIAGLSGQSLHPLSIQLHKTLQELGYEQQGLADVTEHPGLGLAANWRGGTLRLGARDWCGIDSDDKIFSKDHPFQTFASFEGGNGKRSVAGFAFEDCLRDGAIELVEFFKQSGIEVYLFSGDQTLAVSRFARHAGIERFQGEMRPQAKALAVRELEAAGRRVFMIGDGINDGPSLKAASVSLSPNHASDLAKVSASFVLLNESFRSIIWLYRLAKQSRWLIGQNFGLAVIYNLIAVPTAMLGGVTPIVAALAMSGSSLAVMANALRLFYLARRPVR